MISLEKLAEYLGMAGFALASLDEDETGADDIAGQFMAYGADLCVAIHLDTDFPPLPDIAAKMIAGRLSQRARMLLLVVGMTLSVVQMQIGQKNPKAAMAFRYISQAMTSLLAGRALPAAPAALMVK